MVNFLAAHPLDDSTDRLSRYSASSVFSEITAFALASNSSDRLLLVASNSAAFCVANQTILRCVLKCCCFFLESILRHLQVSGVGGQLVLVQTNVLLLTLLWTLQTQTECRVPQSVQRLSSQLSWHSNSCAASNQYRHSGSLHPIHHDVDSKSARCLESNRIQNLGDYRVVLQTVTDVEDPRGSRVVIRLRHHAN